MAYFCVLLELQVPLNRDYSFYCVVLVALIGVIEWKMFPSEKQDAQGILDLEGIEEVYGARLKWCIIMMV